MSSPRASVAFGRVAVAGLLLAVARFAGAAPTLPGVGTAMQAVIDAREVAGAVTLVANKDKIVHLEATGFADIAKRQPMETDATFWLASVTKPVTAVAVLMLQEEGKLSLTDPVAKYLPAFAELKTPSGKPANLTVAQLLSHTSGIADIPRAAYRSTTNLAELIGGYSPAPMQYEPEARWKYTSVGFDTAGRIVEIVSGKTFDVFLRERLFGPLGMTDTTFYPSDEQWGRLASNYGRNRDGSALELRALQNPRPVAGKFPPIPGGGLFSTASDMARFGRMLLNRGVLDGRRYLSEASYKTMTTIRTGDLATGFSNGQLNQVLGWGLGAYVLRAPHAGASAALSSGSFGHPGACGTHLIVDPVKGLVYVLMVQRPNLPDNFENEPTRAFVSAVAAASSLTP